MYDTEEEDAYGLMTALGFPGLETQKEGKTSASDKIHFFEITAGV